jgi:hypothetical protein
MDEIHASPSSFEIDIQQGFSKVNSRDVFIKVYIKT